MSKAAARKELVPFQVEDRDWIVKRPNRLYAGDPGIGKTLVSIRAADAIGAERMLVVCPPIATEVWVRHLTAEQELPRIISPVFAASGRSPRATIVSMGRLSALPKLTRALADAGPYDLIVLDEVHALANLGSNRTQAIYGDGALGGSDALIASGKRVWALTGSPMMNSPRDLYPHMRALAPETLLTGSPRRVMDEDIFLERYTFGEWGPHGYKTFRAKNQAELAGRLRIGEFMRRRRKRDVLPQIPFPIIDLYPIPKPSRAPLASRQVTELRDAYGDDEDGLLAALQQEEVHLSTELRLLGVSKIEAVAELAENDLAARPDGKIVIFTKHHQVTDGLAERLKRFGVGVVDGRTPKPKRDAFETTFQTDPRILVGVLQIRAAATSITLTASSNAIFAETDFNPEANNQAIGRLDRFGQTEPVLARFVVANNTLDEIVMRVVQRKTADINRIIDHPLRVSAMGSQPRAINGA